MPMAASSCPNDHLFSKKKKTQKHTQMPRLIRMFIEVWMFSCEANSLADPYTRMTASVVLHCKDSHKNIIQTPIIIIPILMENTQNYYFPPISLHMLYTYNCFVLLLLLFGIVLSEEVTSK